MSGQPLLAEDARALRPLLLPDRREPLELRVERRVAPEREELLARRAVDRLPAAVPPSWAMLSRAPRTAPRAAAAATSPARIAPASP
ncbi:MAG: hypothetical protein JO321_17965 [Solirubrobacterales bacterium]|nr:hypothetical protein [Solirubrobacterales bacterium]MBV9167940.1 hypothetical protein [Solirubrobacterales bacterium]MBV9537290.1 hypothetical protein [Solirubrobacterales bacterium]